MACTAFHLLVAEKYCEKHKNADKQIFAKGAIFPDIQEDRVGSHFGLKIKTNTIKEALNAKIDIKKCTKSVDFDDEMSRAIYLHILTDYIYYNHLYKEELEAVSLNKVLADIFNDAGVMTGEILQNHPYTLPDKYSFLLNEKENCGEYLLFDPSKFDVIVEMISSFDLDDVKVQIMKNDEEFLCKCLDFLNNCGYENNLID